MKKSIPIENQYISLTETQLKKRELLGEINCVSGVLGLVDFGGLGQWTVDDDSAKETNTSRAMKIVQKAETGVLDFGDYNAVLFGNIPKQKTFKVWGRRLGKKPFPDLWHTIDIDVNPNSAASGATYMGAVFVEQARLLWGDVQAFDLWKENSSHDGKADVVFWGQDEKKLVETFHAIPVGEVWGLTDLSLEEADKKTADMHDVCSKNNWLVMGEVRVHDWHDKMLKLIDENPTQQSGVMQIESFSVCGFMTQCGDGVFPVFKETSSQGEIVRLRLVLGTKEAIRSMKIVNGM